MKRTRISILFAIVLLLQLCVPLTANAADFTPNPQTEYAKRFIAACDGQTWLPTWLIMDNIVRIE